MAVESIGSHPGYKGHSGGGLADGGEPPHDGGMEARVAKLEATVEHIQKDVADLKADVRTIRDTTAKCETRLAVIETQLQHIPTSAELMKIVNGAMWKVLVAIGAFALAALLKALWPVMFPGSGG